MTKISTKVKAYIEHGMYAACRNEYEEWRVFMHINSDGRVEGTERMSTIEESLDLGLVEDTYSPADIDQHFNHVEPLPRPIKYFKEGDLVDILENTRELPRFHKWVDVAKKMVGQKGLEVRGASSAEYTVYTKDKSDWFPFPHHVLAPHFPDNEMSDQELLAELEKRGLLEDKKVIK